VAFLGAFLWLIGGVGAIETFERCLRIYVVSAIAWRRDRAPRIAPLPSRKGGIKSDGNLAPRFLRLPQQAILFHPNWL